MRRRVAHSVFAAIAVSCAVIAAYEAVQLRQANHVNASIAGAMVSDDGSSLAEARFARALALARAGNADAAMNGYKEVIQGNRVDLKVAAFYNLGNLYMREAQMQEKEDPSQSLPLVELAKQSYRNALRIAPRDWNARYNLERALRMAPEVDDVVVDDDDPEAPEEHVSSTLQGAKMDLP